MGMIEILNRTDGMVPTAVLIEKRMLHYSLRNAQVLHFRRALPAVPGFLGLCGSTHRKRGTNEVEGVDVTQVLHAQIT